MVINHSHNNPKQNGTFRICVDFRKLHVATNKNPNPHPICKKSLMILCAMINSRLFWGILPSNNGKGRWIQNKFLTDWEPYEFERMPFGAMNAPLKFHRVMELIFKDFVFKIFGIHLDDGAIYGPMMQHTEHLEQISETCRQNNVGLITEYCSFLYF